MAMAASTNGGLVEMNWIHHRIVGSWASTPRSISAAEGAECHSTRLSSAGTDFMKGKDPRDAHFHHSASAGSAETITAPAPATRSRWPTR